MTLAKINVRRRKHQNRDQLGETCTGASSSLNTGDCLSLAVQYTRWETHFTLKGKKTN